MRYNIDMWIKKTTGEREEYDPEKIRKTCLRAGASLELADQVVNMVSARVRNGSSTRKILEMTLEYLAEKDPLVATKYNLKDAILNMGPDGFAFEILLTEIFKLHGYKTQNPDILYGACVGHEVDIVASKASKTYMVECKFHSKIGLYTRIKDILYSQSRFMDLKEGYKAKTCPINFSQVMLVCNTRFSDDVLKYAKCKNIRLLSWKYPDKEGLRDLLESKKLYPVTALRSLSKEMFKKLIEHKLVLCRDLTQLSIKEIQEKIGVNQSKAQEIYNEAKILIQ